MDASHLSLDRQLFCHVERKFPKPKSQAPNNSQMKNPKIFLARGHLWEVGNLDFDWALEVGIWSFDSKDIHPRLPAIRRLLQDAIRV
jgi:hypothetical protein